MNVGNVNNAPRDRARFLKFLAVGALNTVFGYAVFAICIWLGLHFTIAAAISTVLGTLFNFKTTGRLVFGSRQSSRLGRFIGVYLVIYCTNIAGVWSLMTIGATAYWAGMLMIAPLALLSYTFNSRFVFDP